MTQFDHVVSDLIGELCTLMLDQAVDVDIRLTAAEALGARCDARAIPALLLALDDLGTSPIGDVLICYGTRVTELVVRWIDSPDPKRRVAAALALSRIKEQRSLESVLRASRDHEPSVRRVACWALVNQGGDAAAAALIAAARTDCDRRVRQTAAEAIGFLGDAHNAPILSVMARHDLLPEVREAAEFGLELLLNP